MVDLRKASVKDLTKAFVCLAQHLQEPKLADPNHKAQFEA